MNRCELQNPTARKTVAAVWRHLRKHHPADARFLFAVVKRIIPLKIEEVEDGTRGEWLPDPRGTNFPLGSIEGQSWWRRIETLFNGEDHGQGYGVLKLMDTEDLPAGVVAHELGHAFTSEDDERTTAAPDDEWASEAAADMHAVRWGLLPREDVRNRHAANVKAVNGEGVTCGAAWVHHGPPPGGPWIEHMGDRWRLRDNFVFERE